MILNFLGVKKKQGTIEKYPNFRSRLLASTIDMIIMLPIVFGMMGLRDEPQEVIDAKNHLRAGEITLLEYNAMMQEYFLSGGWGSMLGYATVDFVVIGMAVILFWFYKAATPGKMILGMRIKDADDEENDPSKIKLVIRYFGYIVSSLPLCIGFIWIAFDKKNQAFHDKISGTVVVYNKPIDDEMREKQFKRNTIFMLVFFVVFFIYISLRGGF